MCGFIWSEAWKKGFKMDDVFDGVLFCFVFTGKRRSLSKKDPGRSEPYYLWIVKEIPKQNGFVATSKSKAQSEFHSKNLCLKVIYIQIEFKIKVTEAIK